MTPWQSLEHPPLGDLSTMHRAPPHSPCPPPVLFFSLCVHTLLSVLSDLPPAPELAWGTHLLGFAPACTPVLGREKASAGLGLPASGLFTRELDGLDSLCLADFAHYTIWLWIAHSRCCFRLRSAPILCLSVPQCCALWGLPRLGLVRCAAKNVPVLGHWDLEP